MEREYYELFEGHAPGEPIKLYWDRGNGELSDTFVFLGSLPEKNKVFLVHYKTAIEDREKVQLLNLEKMGILLKVEKDETVDKLPPVKCISLVNRLIPTSALKS